MIVVTHRAIGRLVFGGPIFLFPGLPTMLERNLKLDAMFMVMSVPRSISLRRAPEAIVAGGPGAEVPGRCHTAPECFYLRLGCLAPDMGVTMYPLFRSPGPGRSGGPPSPPNETA